MDEGEGKADGQTPTVTINGRTCPLKATSNSKLIVDVSHLAGQVIQNTLTTQSANGGTPNGTVVTIPGAPVHRPVDPILKVLPPTFTFGPDGLTYPTSNTHLYPLPSARQYAVLFMVNGTYKEAGTTYDGKVYENGRLYLRINGPESPVGGNHVFNCYIRVWR